MTLVLTPAGHLVMIARDASINDAAVPFRAEAVKQAFTISPPAGIMALAGGKSASDWPLPWMFWRDFGTRYLLLLCQTQPTAERLEPIPSLDASTLAHLILNISPMPGAEYGTPDVLAGIWNELDAWALASIARHADGLAGFLI